MCTNTVVLLYKETLKFTPDVHMAGKDYIVKETYMLKGLNVHCMHAQMYAKQCKTKQAHRK